jgi:glycosyltransferase involved in cell wall biosynthesis
MATSETSADPIKVSIVVPAFNEASRIGESVRKIEEFLKRVPWSAEIVIVDDGSTDKTAAIVSEARIPGLRLLRSETNHGKGHAVRAGVLDARGDYVIFSDADLSAPIEELQKLLTAAETQSADVVIGSRAVDRSFIEKHQSRGREVGGIIFNRIVRIVLGLKIHDTQCGFKMFRRQKIRPIFEKMTIEGFGFDPELLFLSSKAGLKILEIPVRWSHAEGSKIRFMRDSVRMFTDLLQIRWNHLTGKYS